MATQVVRDFSAELGLGRHPESLVWSPLPPLEASDLVTNLASEGTAAITVELGAVAE